MAGIYIHIPFCKRICAYCDFYKSARIALLDRVVGRMHDELEQRSDYLSDKNIRTIYFGGGTPSLCRPKAVGEIIEHISQLFDTSALEEVTLEANPDDLDEEYLAELRQVGVNRLSIGIQSLDDDVLRWMNRRHNSESALRSVEVARKAGFDNISVDLIFGLPGFELKSLEHTIDGLLGMGVEHISAYHLTIEPDTLLGRRCARGELCEIDENLSEEQFAIVHQRLTSAGYEHYEISNYALKGYRSRHNSSYWQGIEYLGIGPAAHSFDGKSRRWSTDTVESYYEVGEFAFEQEQLSDVEHFNEYVMTRLRTSEGVDLDYVSHRFGRVRAERLRVAAEPFVGQGIVLLEADALSIKPDSFLLSDMIIEQLIEI